MQTIREDGPPFSFEVAAAKDFREVTRGGKPMSHAFAVRVTGAGEVELRPKHPRDGFTTEVFTVAEQGVIPGKFVEIVSADSGCFPIHVMGI